MLVRNALYLPLVLGVFLLIGGVSQGQESNQVELSSIGLRGGVNLEHGGIPPSEKEDFYQGDVFAVINLPWSWQLFSDWETRIRLTVSAGTLAAAGDEGFITEFTPNFAFTNWDWRVTIDAGGGGAYISDYKYGRQDIGGPFQFIGFFGITYHLTDHYLIGWRFHHMSDATIWGTDNRGVDFHMLELSYRF